MMARRLAWQFGHWWEVHRRCHGRRSRGQNDRQPSTSTRAGVQHRL